MRYTCIIYIINMYITYTLKYIVPCIFPLYFFTEILNCIDTYPCCIFPSIFCLFFHRILMISTCPLNLLVLCAPLLIANLDTLPHHDIPPLKQFCLFTFCCSVLSCIRVVKFLDITGFP